MKDITAEGKEQLAGAQLKDFAAKVKTFEGGLTPEQRQVYNTAMKNASEDRLQLLFGDPTKRKELETFLREKAGVDSSIAEDQPGTIATVVVTVLAHC